MLTGWRLAGAAAVACAAVALAVTGCGASAPEDSEELLVAAASDLRPAFEELGEAFELATGVSVTFSFGSSGQLKQQVINGAPFDVFASANEEFVDEVIDAGRGRPATKAMYALGRLALWSPVPIERPESIHDLVDQRFRRVAIANPDHAPYGLAARQTLESSGIWAQVSDRLVMGENISDTLRLASSGNADAAIIALSLAIAEGSGYTLVPADLHAPLRQSLVVTATEARAELATGFVDFVFSSSSREVMERYGFSLPSLPSAQDEP